MWRPFKKRKPGRIIVVAETAEQARGREERRVHSEAVYERIWQVFDRINRAVALHKEHSDAEAVR